MKTGQIYIIKNKINNKVYIGQTTTNYKTRFIQHCKPSCVRTRHYKLYNAIKKYGKDNFYIELLETNIPIDKLNEKEISYIEEYNSFNKGYNATKGGDGRTINKQYDEEDIVFMYKNGITTVEIGEKYNVCGTTIARVLEKLGIKRRANGNKYERFDKDLFIKLWNDKYTPLPEMAKIFNVHPRTLKRFANKIGLGEKKYRRSVTTIKNLSKANE